MLDTISGTVDFVPFGKIARLNRRCVITEKIDGTNAQVAISEDGRIAAGSRNRTITPSDDNYGFAAWVLKNQEELLTLGPGRHFGEWWGAGIGRKYGLSEKRFSLFNTSRWLDDSVRPACCSVVPVLFDGIFCAGAAEAAISELRYSGSHAAPGFMKPEGVIVYHVAGDIYFKATIEKDEEWKGKGLVAE